MPAPLQRPVVAEGRKLPESYGKSVRRTSWKLTPSEPDNSEGVQEGAEHLPESCPEPPPGAQFRPRLNPNWSQVAKGRPTSAKCGRHLAKLDQSWPMWAKCLTMLAKNWTNSTKMMTGLEGGVHIVRSNCSTSPSGEHPAHSTSTPPGDSKTTGEIEAVEEAARKPRPSHSTASDAGRPTLKEGRRGNRTALRAPHAGTCAQTRLHNLGHEWLLNRFRAKCLQT